MPTPLTTIDYTIQCDLCGYDPYEDFGDQEHMNAINQFPDAQTPPGFQRWTPEQILEGFGMTVTEPMLLCCHCLELSKQSLS